MLLNNPSMSELWSVLAYPPNGDFRIQFSESTGYDAARLAIVNEICGKVGPAVSIRFYAHYSSVIDCAVTSHLPACRSLFLDSHHPINNIGAIASMSPLDKFGINVFDANYDEVLSFSNVQTARTLYIGTNRTQDWNLAPLREFTALMTLSLSGQYRNITAIGELQGLDSLWLNSIPRKASLEFVTRMSRLKKLKVMLGGRDSIDEINHSGITELEVIRVKGLSHIDVSKFPAIEIFKLEDQANISELDISKNPEIKKIYIDNCRSLKYLHIEGLTKLTSLSIGRTAIDPEYIFENPLPAPLTIFDIWGYGRKKDTAITKLLRSRGYRSMYNNNIR